MRRRHRLASRNLIVVLVGAALLFSCKAMRAQGTRLESPVARQQQVEMPEQWPRRDWSPPPPPEGISVAHVGLHLSAPAGRYLGVPSVHDDSGVSMVIPGLPGAPRQSREVKPGETPELTAALLESSPAATAARLGLAFVPGDSVVAHGPAGHGVALSGRRIRFFDASGEVVFDAPLESFFGQVHPLLGTLEARVFYDGAVERFLVVATETLGKERTAAVESPSTFRIFVAVSDDHNPSGEWFMTYMLTWAEIDGVRHVASFEGLLFDEGAAYLAMHLAGIHMGKTTEGRRLWVIEKGHESEGIYDGGPATVRVFGY